MRLHKDFALRQVAENWIVLPLGEKNVDFSGMLTLNESGAMLWEQLSQGTTLDALVTALTEEYEVDDHTARRDVQAFLDKLQKAGCLDLTP